MQFKRGHALFEMERYDDARLDLFAVMEAGAAGLEKPARYYFSHISIERPTPGRPRRIRIVERRSQTQAVVPIYVAQLLHETEQYDRLIDYAPVVFADGIELSKSPWADISRLVGDALYRRQISTTPFPYLEEAYHATRGMGRTRDLPTRWDTPISKRRSTSKP